MTTIYDINKRLETVERERVRKLSYIKKTHTHRERERTCICNGR